MWMWAKWLLVLDSFWRNKSPLPEWATLGELYSQVSVSCSEGRLVTAGVGYLSYTRRYQLKVNNGTVFDLSSMINIVLSADSEPPKKNILDGEIISYQGDFQTRSAEKTQAHGEGIFGKIKDTFKGTVSAVSNIIEGGEFTGTSYSSITHTVVV